MDNHRQTFHVQFIVMNIIMLRRQQDYQTSENKVSALKQTYTTKCLTFGQIRDRSMDIVDSGFTDLPDYYL